MRREAARWLARLQSGREPDAQAKFERWYGADPAHADAFERVRGSYEQSGLLRHSSDYVSPSSRPLTGSADGTTVFAFAVAATLAVIAIGLVLLRGSPLLRETDAVMLKTNIGEIRRVALNDGSSITLDTSTRVEVEIGKSTRRARVRYGRARFEIAPAREPFVVEAGNEKVTAARGTIDVECEGPESRINVLAGMSQLQLGNNDGGSPLLLKASDEAVVSMGPHVRTYKRPAAPDWTLGMLQFEGMPLAEVAKLANRYSDQQIRLDGNLGELKVTGAFRAGDTADLAKSLAAAFKLSAHQAQDGNWHLAAAKQSSSPDRSSRGEPAADRSLG